MAGAGRRPTSCSAIPDEGNPATERTEIRVLFDDDAIYVGARMFDGEPRAIARRLTRRDQDSDDLADAIHVSFDPHHDHLTGGVLRDRGGDPK